MQPRRLRRFPGFDYTGPHRYSLTLSTFQRRPQFSDAELVAAVVEQILIAAAKCSFDVIAYCAMPDHVHVVAHGNAVSAELLTFVHKAKQLSGYHGKRVAGRPIWQTGYFERVVRETEDTRNVVAYVLRNPVRKQLVNDPRDYPHSGSGLGTLDDLIDYVRDFL
jgi:putative transposase